ncbi:hypothetical protein GCM10011414_03790 [Croceivirga lutea]|uniref:hypothetical protein n=1 Tax=Croceivirga lutea TaxID=1775167 RepID=UPI00163AE788|nr:hypothetical protein [Croceivirga lutea]GGG37663.1 hypothetical protein GCM10011414_03790 [Croceivirga lutea]
MGSASQPMLVIKANRALLKKRVGYQEISKKYKGYVNDTQLEFKELTPFEKKKLKYKIRAQAKKDRKEEINHYLIAFGFLLIILSGLFLLFNALLSV